jgi:putative endopeptidase
MTLRSRPKTSTAPLRQHIQHIRPQDDFFGFVNSQWIQDNPIPDDKSRWGTFDVLQENVRGNLRLLYEKLQGHPDIMPSTPDQQVRDLYYTAMHADDFTDEHLTQLESICQKIDQIKDKTSLSACMGELNAIGVSTPWDVWVDCDNKDSERHILHISQDGLTLPNRDYYLDDSKEMKKVRDAYAKHLQQIFTHFPYVAQESALFNSTVTTLETLLAKRSHTDAALRDVEANYNKTSFATLKETYTNIDWDSYAAALGWQPDDQISIDQPDFLQYVDSLFSTVTVEEWKIYLKWHFLAAYYGQVNESFAQLKFDFFGKTISGVKKVVPKWKRAIEIVNGSLGQAAGKLYVEEYFPEASKQQVFDLVEQVRASYASRIAGLDWMDTATKALALEKLANIKVLVGYPDTWRDYSALKIGRESLISNLVASEKHNNAYSLERLKHPVSRDEWLMDPQTVNAYNDPSRLVICFPAAILMSPFFDSTASHAVNLGGIGSVIGHELTHGFDDQGSRYDSKGNVRVWQSTQDRKHFATRADIIVRQADAYEPLPGLHMQGNLVIGESIADLGGIEIAYDALCKAGDKNDAQAFFIANAVLERGVTRDEKKRELAFTDPHPDAPFRINGMLQHVDGFYEAFDVREGDELYRPEAKRARIW